MPLKLLRQWQGGLHNKRHDIHTFLWYIICIWYLNDTINVYNVDSHNIAQQAEDVFPIIRW